MKEVDFCIFVRPTTVLSDRQLFEIAALDERGLRRIVKGKIFVIIQKPRDFIVIESEILDYLDQLSGVIKTIDSGQHSTFTVSGDYYSNSLQFTYSPDSKKLEIYEGNGGDFRILMAYKTFRNAFLGFYKEALTDLTLLYPELEDNLAFRRIAESVKGR